MRRTAAVIAIACFGLWPAAVAAQSALQQELKDFDIASHWIYDDLPRAIEQARSSGKPLMVVLRCVPCPPGRTLDGQVMQPNDAMERVQRQFVCVRVIQTKGLDLKLFQYDYDMSWAAMFLNADGTIYGRYGSRNAHGPRSDEWLSAAGFRKAAERALELHKGYPANRQQLAGKTGGPVDYARPELIPGLEDRAEGQTTRKTCIHCHMVKEYALRAKWKAGTLSLKDLLVYPMPQQIGLAMDVDDGLLIKSVEQGSPAAKAGLAAGDQLVSLSGQPLISMADIQWVLHTAADESQLPAVVRRNGELLRRNIVVSGDWKRSDIAWRASSWYGLRQGFKTEPLSAAEKQKLGLPANGLALAVKGLYGVSGPLMQRIGLRKDDIIVAVDGNTQEMDETEFLINLRLRHGPQDSVRFTVLRGDARREFTIPMW